MKKKNKKRYIPSKEENGLSKTLIKITSTASRVGNEGFKAKKLLDNYGIKEDKCLKSLEDVFKLISVLHAYEDEFAENLQKLKRKLEDERLQKEKQE